MSDTENKMDGFAAALKFAAENYKPTGAIHIGGNRTLDGDSASFTKSVSGPDGEEAFVPITGRPELAAIITEEDFAEAAESATAKIDAVPATIPTPEKAESFADKFVKMTPEQRGRVIEEIIEDDVNVSHVGSPRPQ